MARDSTTLDRRTALRVGGGLATTGLAALAGCSGGDGGSSDGGDGSSGDGSSDGGSGGTTTSGGDGGSDVTTIVHGAVDGGTTGILTTVMQAQGIGEKHGIKLEPKLFASPPKVQKQLVFNQDIPTAYMGGIIATRMHAKGKHPQLVGPYMLNHTYVLSRGEEIMEPEDLRGKMVTFASTAADAWLKFVVLLDESAGVKRDEYEFVQSAPPAALSLLNKGEVDAVLSFEPLATKGIQMYDFHEVFSPREAWREIADLPLTTVDLAWTKSWYDSHQEAATNLAKAFRETQQYLTENMATVMDKHKDAFGFKNQAQVDLGKKRIKQIYPTEWNHDDFVESELTMVRKANEKGLLDPEPTEEIFNWVL